MFPAANEVSITGLGGLIVVPLCTVQVNRVKAATLGDLVAGNVVGTVTTGSTSVFIDNKPAAMLTSLAIGVHSPTGAPVTDSIVIGSPDVFIGP